MSASVYCVMINGHIVTQPSSFVYVMFLTVQYRNCTRRLWHPRASFCTCYRWITCTNTVVPTDPSITLSLDINS